MSSTQKVSYPHTPDYVRLLPPGEIITEKIFEMGIDAAELAKRCELPEEVITQLLEAKIPLSPEIADKLEKVTWMPAETLLRFEKRYQEDLDFIQKNPDYPVI